MPFASALSEHPDPAVAVGEVAGRLLEGIGDEPDVVLVFATLPHAGALRSIAATLRRVVRPGVLAGTIAAGIVGTDREVEDRPGLSVWAARTGDARAVRLVARPAGQHGVDIDGWPEPADLGFAPSAVVAVADPYSFPAEALLAMADAAGLPVFGGLCSAGQRPTFVLDDRAYEGGAWAVFLGPGAAVEAVVSQGCRPIGDAWAVTSTDGPSVVRTLGGRPPIERLSALAAECLTSEEVALVNRGGLHVGRVIDEHKATFERGDFLVRNVVGADRATGALAIGDRVEVGTTLQFHLRDAVAADEDIHALLRSRTADAALLFTCNGRGVSTFGVADHDARALRDEVGPVPVAGFFAAGEFGPVGGRNFLHGFTASVALLKDRAAPG
ncbi:MAG TPA: FIST N-terminal domain-containing protein [Acidimicrobiales bacterium]|nr:FIST N-terminal domain-containing protein [Acidimicrobiales bacterium]